MVEATGIPEKPSRKRVPAYFFRTELGNEPVREWLLELSREDRRLIGTDIKTVAFGWPLGMPTCRNLGNGLHEVRTNLPGHRTARVLFYVDRRGRMVLLHGFIKKTQRTPPQELDIARINQARHERGLK